jgi:pseudaminic acid cytidylyltransferase
MPIAIIPARGGSKRIPGKNIKPFRGRPVIAYGIAAARQAGVFDRIIVSTDAADIARVARDCGAEAPFSRPPELADDYTATAPVLLHALEWLAAQGVAPQFCCCIYPAAPLVQAQDLRAGLELLKQDGVKAVIPVTSFPFPVFRAFTLTPAGRLALMWPEHELTRSNDLPPAYHDAGQFYWLRVDAFMLEKKIYLPDAAPLVLPRWRVQDLDTLEDWQRAEVMYNVLMEQKLIQGI